MVDRNQLLTDVATIVQDYRLQELPRIDENHINRWLNQFERDAQLPILFELKHILSKTYFSKRKIEKFLVTVINSDKLTSNSRHDFWRNASFLDIQNNGNSQKEMLSLMDGLLQTECGFSLNDCNQANDEFIYIDDIIFTGNRVKDDLESWIINLAPNKCKIHVIVIAYYTSSWYYREKILPKIIAEAGKEIKIKWWHCITFENQKNNKNSSEVLWPTMVPDYQDVQDHVASVQKFPFEPRVKLVKFESQIFSSEENRSMFEQHMLSAGVRIRGFCREPSESLRPLGFSSFGLGFGATVVTYRNCPNNSPLAFWWGDPSASMSNPLSNWYPLFQRKTYD